MAQWARKHIKCVTCWLTESSHMGKWICHKCYDKKRAKSKIRRQKQLWYRLKYMENNPDIVEKCKQQHKEYLKQNAKALMLLEKWKRWEKAGKQMVKYKWYSIPIDIQKDKNWEIVKQYLDNRQEMKIKRI